MKGLEELLVMAFDDLQPCCSKPKHRAKAMRKAMTEAARTWHEEKHGWFPGAYIIGGYPPFEKCWAFPCRVMQEFGPEETDD